MIFAYVAYEQLLREQERFSYGVHMVGGYSLAYSPWQDWEYPGFPCMVVNFIALYDRQKLRGEGLGKL